MYKMWRVKPEEVSVEIIEIEIESDHTKQCYLSICQWWPGILKCQQWLLVLSLSSLLLLFLDISVRTRYYSCLTIVSHVWFKGTEQCLKYLAWCYSPQQWRHFHLSSWLRNHWPEHPAAWRPGPGPTGAAPSWRRPSTSPGPSWRCCPPSRTCPHQSQGCSPASPR